MATTIKLRNSVTTTSAPSSLVQGELAINITDKKVWVGNAATTPIQLLGDGASLNFTSLSLSGNLTFTGTGNRITGDFSNATQSNRVAFQTSTTNGNTIVTALPNGTGTTSAFNAINNSDPTNASITQVVCSSTESAIRAQISGTGTYLPLTFQTNNAERLRIDTSGNVGIGTSSPIVPLHVASSANLGVRFQATGTGSILLNYSANSADRLYVGTESSSGGGILGTGAAYAGVISTASTNPLVFGTNSAERMRIDSSGNVGIGTTATSSYDSKFIVSGNAALTSTGNKLYLYYNSATNHANLSTSAGGDITFTTGTSSPTERMRITSGGEVYIAGTTDQGAYNLQVNGTGVWGAGAYVNGSDERIKDNIAPLDSGLDVVSKLNPVTYKYKEDWSKDQSTQTGFIAQELLTALEGKNYVDGVVQQGGEYMSVAYQNIIPILTKAIQEQQAMIEELKQEVAKLKGV